jgi:hypothetical protein
MLKCNSSSHAAKPNERRCRMDCRVKPGNDERKIPAAPARTSQADGDRRVANSAPPLASLFRRFHSLQEEKQES